MSPHGVMVETAFNSYEEYLRLKSMNTCPIALKQYANRVYQANIDAIKAKHELGELNKSSRVTRNGLKKVHPYVRPQIRTQQECDDLQAKRDLNKRPAQVQKFDSP
jgi:hypothetical protein